MWHWQRYYNLKNRECYCQPLIMQNNYGKNEYSSASSKLKPLIEEAAEEELTGAYYRG